MHTDGGCKVCHSVLFKTFLLLHYGCRHGGQLLRQSNAKKIPKMMLFWQNISRQSGTVGRSYCWPWFESTSPSIPWMSLLEEERSGSEAEICSGIGYAALLVNAEMLLVGVELWRTTVTWSKASAWSELTTVDMFTFLHGLPSRGDGGGKLLFFICLFILKGAAYHSRTERMRRTSRADFKVR